MKKCLAVLLVLVSGGAAANSACNKPYNGFDGLSCHSEVYQQADADLSTAYQSLSAKLDGGRRVAPELSQLAWARSRDSHGSESRGGAFGVDRQCATYITTKRAEFPQECDRECVSSGCQNGTLPFS